MKKTKVIGIMGVPACGKSTLMKKLISEYDRRDWIPFKKEQLVTGIKLKKQNLYILGTYADGETFGGTDRLSMAVQPKVKIFLQNIPAGSTVVFEGDRLSNASFFEYVLDEEETLDLNIINIEVDKSIIAERHIDRKDEQSEQFCQSRETKYSNILSNFVLMDSIETFANNNVDEQRIILEYISSLI